ncbi:MAG: hypothetical protein PHH59_03320 [Methylovulum sp.]|uniref:hypothetical protein n=1 Tax=Methylovulum sp. TaxID=1916980 RepID=UPI0026232719|nr:hypothetical protein [Methylovulum sp.]MDD2723038.1 hypothetical protein [Methylovulum sp.]MDD5123773.1 hypothetical protein [Methylovulum sp.]
MLTLQYPSLMLIIQQMPVGILPLLLKDEECPIFIVKAPKEYILAAKINASLKIYLVPVIVDNQKTFGLVTAFFDDEDEPLVIKTPLFSDDFSITLFESLRNGRINVHFFDELSRERLVYRAHITIPDETQQKIDEITLLDFSFPNARAMMDEIETFFGLRTSLDDDRAIGVSLNESVYGEDLFIQDLRPEQHSYHGSRGFSHTILEREEPGSYQEEDIIQCLLSVFSPEQIYLSPKRIHDKEEICDILVITDTKLLIIQAKDSPNIKRISRQKLSRKRSNVVGALKKAIEQVKGAIGYYRRIGGRLEFLINGKQYSIDTTQLEVKALIVVKELFNDQYSEYSPLLLEVFRDKAVPCIALDYPELYQFCAHLQNEEDFFDAYNTVMVYAAKYGEYPRLRFGLVE